MERLGYAIIFYNENSHVGAGGSLSIRLVVSENSSGDMLGRIYPDGEAAPAFSPLVSTFLQADGLTANDLYVVEYKDDNGERILGKVTPFALANSCYDDAGSERGMIGYVQISSTGVRVWTNVRPTSNPAREISIDGGTTWKTTLNANAILEWTNSELETLGVDDSIPSITIRRLSDACTIEQASEIKVRQGFADMEVDYEATDCTADGADDGTITLSVSGGSGNFTFLWNDAAVTQNRSNLAPGIYSVTVHDVDTGEDVLVEDILIEDPQPVTVTGTLLEFPVLNSLHFVVDPKGSEITVDSSVITADSDEITVDAIDDDSRRTPDNVLFADQAFGNFARSCYNQKHVFTDEPIVQFNSDFGSHVIQLISQLTGEVVRSFASNLVEENIGVVEDFGVTIRNHTDNPGKSRVYFNVGALPIPLNAGDIFTVLNNAEGFNGSYEILEIINDILLGYQYLVINLNYTGAASTSAATGRFLSSAEDYNVHEVTLNFLDLDESNYYVKVTAFNILNDVEVIGKIGVSEPIRLKAIWLNTNLIEYRNVDNGYGDITWTTGYVGRIRVESLLGHKRLVSGGERGISRNSDYSPVKTYAKKVRAFLFETFMLPPYLHEKLGLIFDCDSWSINGVAYQATEGYADPSYLFKVKLSNSSIRIEQLNWMRKYNSHDIGTVAEGGFLLTEQGFLKL